MEVENFKEIENQKIVYLVNKEPKRTLLDTIRTVFGIAFAIVNLVSFVLALCFLPKILNFFANGPSNEQGEAEFFSYHTAKDFSDIQYYGRADMFTSIISDMMESINLSTSKNPKELIGLSDTCRNFLLYGPSGTGKTHFIKRLVYLLNEKLKKKYKENKDIVRAYFISPSMIESKYRGEPEKLVARLFKEARKDEGWKATIIFVDEVDAFFANREMSHRDLSSGLKSEFLNIMSGITSDATKNIFFMGATNYKSIIDEAFLRRMGKQKEFPIPNEFDVFEMLKSICQDWAKDTNMERFLKNIAKILSDRKTSQFFITEICRTIVRRGGHKKANVFCLFSNLVINAEQIRSLKMQQYEQENQGSPSYEMGKAQEFKFNLDDFDFDRYGFEVKED
ncbi:spastin-like protein [Vairimorpha necatrix]|uniref:Spastin-like protein n=1 Tax=Vairimorpha necatrix TaxID=6039 RepID=A0AAX4JAF4_9MICR